MVKISIIQIIGNGMVVKILMKKKLDNLGMMK